MTALANNSLDLEVFYKNDELPTIKVGATVRVTIYLELPKESVEGEKKDKERIQAYEGVVISRHKTSDKIDSTITVRKLFQGGGIEKVFVLNSPWIKTITVLKSAQVKRSKLYYLRERTGKSARLKTQF